MAEFADFELIRVIRWKVKDILSGISVNSEEFSFNGTRWSFRFVTLIFPTKICMIYLNKENSAIDNKSEFETRAYIEDNDAKPHLVDNRSQWRDGIPVWEVNFSYLRKWKKKNLKDDDATFIIYLIPETVFEYGSESDAESVNEASTNVVESANEASTNVVESANEASINVVESANEASTNVVESANKASTSVVESANEASTNVVESANEASTSVVESANEASTNVVESVNQASTKVIESVNETSTNVGTDECLWMDFSVDRLTLDFRHLLDDGTHSDVTLKCGGLTMPAHSCILSARSKVFAAMLRNDMVESRNRVIEISDLDPPVLSQFLQFIYSGKLSDLSMDTAPELYEAGDKYDIASLKRQCLVFLQKNLAVGNVCSILTLAEAHCDGDLKESTVAFILNNQLMKNDEIWLKFCDDHPKLAIEILNRSYKDGSVSSTSGSSLCYKCASVPSGLNLVP